MIGLIITASIFGYCIVGGMAGVSFFRQSKSKCIARGTHGWACDHEFTATWMGIFWPVATPVWLFAALTDPYAKDLRDKVRRDKELDEADHQSRLASIRRRELEDLNRALEEASK